MASTIFAALPVHQAGCILKIVWLESLQQCRVRLGGKPVVVHLQPNERVLPAAIGNQPGEMLHRMALSGLHIMVGITRDIVMAHERRAPGAIGIHAASPPHRLTFEPQQHGLMHIERPSIIAREPFHV